MNHSDEAMPPTDPREEALVRALNAQAETVRPAGDGLVLIRARVERRRSRTRWVLPSASAAAVAATVTAVVASGAFTSGKHTSPLGIGAATLTAATTPAVVTTTKAKRVQPLVTAPTPIATTAAARTAPSPTPVTTISATTAAPTSAVGAEHSTLSGPAPVWPFASEAEAARWQKSASASDVWHLDPIETAEHFVASLKLTGVTLTGRPAVTYANGGSAAKVVLQRTGDAATPLTFATVTLSHWSTGNSAPWGVVSVASPHLDVTEDDVSGPLQVAAPGSTEGELDAAVYQAGAPTAAAHVTVPASGTVAVPPAGSGGSGFVVLTNTAGGGSTPSVGSLAVVQVQLAPSAAPASTYVALVGGKIEVLDASSGAVVRTLAPGATEVTAVAVSDDRQWVYFLEGATGCHGTVWRTRFDGTGTAAQFSSWLDGLTTFDIAGPSAPWMTYVYTPCAGAQQTLFFFHGADGPEPQNISSTSRPPDVKTVAISPDGKQASAFLRTGTEGNVWTFDLTTVPTSRFAVHPTMDTHTIPAACSTGIECVGETYDSNGNLFLVRAHGSQLEVVHENGSTFTVVFSVTASSQLATIDVDPTGTKVVLTDGISKGWVWDGTKATALPGGVTDASW